MTVKEATERFESLTYELAKCVSKLNEIKSSMEYVNDSMGWDGMFLVDFTEALSKMSNVTSGAIVYALEDRYRKRDMENLKNELSAYTKQGV